MKNRLNGLCVCLCILVVSALVLHVAAACTSAEGCAAAAAEITQQSPAHAAHADLPNTFRPGDGNVTGDLNSAPSLYSSAPELSFTPTYTLYLPLLRNPPGRPLAPTGLTVTVAATGTIGLSWNAAVDGGSPVLSYTLSYTPGNGSLPESASCPGGTCTALINSLSNCVPYTITVKATNAFGAGPSSAPVTGIPVQAADPPAQPALARPAIYGARMSVSWSAPNAHGCPIDQYDVQVYRNNTSFATSIQTSASPQIITGLKTCSYPDDTCGTSYTFYVRAHNAGGWSGNSPGNSAIPWVSYLEDNLRGIWSNNTYSSGACTGCHTSSSTLPNLVNTTGFPPADFQSAKNEGTRIYECPAHTAACPNVMTGKTFFSTNSAEYRTLSQWVADGNLQ